MWEFLKNISLFWGQNNINKKINKNFLYNKKNIKIKKIKDSVKMSEIVDKGKIECYVGKHKNKRNIERREFKEVKKSIENCMNRQEQLNLLKKNKGLEKNHFHVQLKHKDNIYKCTQTSVDSVKNFVDVSEQTFVYVKLPVVDGFTPLYKILKELAELYKNTDIYEFIDLKITKNIVVNKIKVKHNLKNEDDIRENLKKNGIYIDMEDIENND